MNNVIYIFFSLLLITGCGEENTILDKNVTYTSSISMLVKEERSKTVIEQLGQPIVEGKQILKKETPEEEPLEGFAAPKSEEELADEQSTDSWEIEEEISVGKVPDKSEKELLDENLATRQPSSDQKSAEELADEKLN